MGLLKNFLNDGGDENVVELQDLNRAFTHLQDSVEGLRFSKRDLAHELSLLVRENARLEEQLHDMKERVEKMEELLQRSRY